MKLHLLKLHKNFQHEVFTGRKTFEFRNNDRDFKEGDLIKFCDVEDGLPVSNAPLYEIDYLLNNFMFKAVPKDWVIFSIKPFENEFIL